MLNQINFPDKPTYKSLDVLESLGGGTQVNS